MRSSYRWVIVAVGALVSCVGIGAMFSLAISAGSRLAMPLYAVLAREYFDERIMGTALGAATMTSSIGMAFGSLAGRWIFDTFNSYSWLYPGSFGAAPGAVAIALAFPPLARDALQPA